MFRLGRRAAQGQQTPLRPGCGGPPEAGIFHLKWAYVVKYNTAYAWVQGAFKDHAKLTQVYWCLEGETDGQSLAQGSPSVGLSVPAEQPAAASTAASRDAALHTGGPKGPPRGWPGLGGFARGGPP